MVELSPRQKEVYHFIDKFITKHGYPPTYAETAAAFKFNVGMVQQVMDALVKKGYAEKIPAVSRGIRLLKNDSQQRANAAVIPLYGQVMAGQPAFADDNIVDYIFMSKTRRSSSSQLFALKVKGDSMIDAGFLEGDTVIVKKQSSADDGDIVIALLEDEATVKTLRKKKNSVYLEPANSKYKSITKPFTILGKVIELRRSLT